MSRPPDWPTRDLLSHRVAATPHATAVIDAATGSECSYAALDQAVDRCLAALPDCSDTGTDDRPRIGIAAATSPAFVVALFAAWRAGAVAVPLATDRPPTDLQARLDRVAPDLLVECGDGEFTDVEPGCKVIGVEPRFDGERPAEPVASRWEPTETALLLFTSGTTGRPKGVRLTHRNLVASATASAFRLGVRPEDRWHCPLPANHMGGLAPIVRATIYGCGVVLEPTFDAGRTGEAMRDYDVTGISLVPTMLRRLLERGWEPHAELRFVLLGGAPAPPELIRECERADVPVWPTYGTTETASQVATATPAEAFASPETVGSPLVTADVTIVDTGDGSSVGAGTPGELVVDGPIVTPGYLDDDATAEAFGEFGLHTGDLARRDTDGRLEILGRLDDAIQTGGETVHPAPVVAVLRSHPAVADAAVVGLPDEEWGERVAAAVVPAEGRAIEVEGIRENLRDELVPYELPAAIEVLDALPRTDSGTVDRAAVRSRLRE